MTKHAPFDQAKLYFLDRSRQDGPYSQLQLRFLFANGAISATTLVWQLRSGRGRAVKEIIAAERPEQRRLGLSATLAVMSVAIFVCAAAAAMLMLPKDSEPEESFAVIPAVKASQHVPKEIPRRQPLRPAAPPNFVSMPPPPPVAISVPKPSFFPARSELPHEFWRSMATVNVAERYRSYLLRFPSGQFAATAASRIMELETTAAAEADGRISEKLQRPQDSGEQRQIKPEAPIVKSSSGDKNSRPSATEAALEVPIPKARCRPSQGERCKDPKAAAPEKVCATVAEGEEQSKLCIVRNYRSLQEGDRLARRR